MTRVEITADSLSDFRGTTLADSLVCLDPDGFTCETRDQADRILARHGWDADVREVSTETAHAVEVRAENLGGWAIIEDAAYGDGSDQGERCGRCGALPGQNHDCGR